jgi:hypothetical protein
VPRAPPLPVVALHPIAAALRAGEASRLIARTRSGARAMFDKAGCETHPVSMEAEAFALDAKQALVLIPCVMGAYQGSSLVFIAPRGGAPARPLILATPYRGNDPERSDYAGMNELTEPEFDPKDGTLHMSAKGRGIGDCGMYASWIWDGLAFRLSDFGLQQACGGVEIDWPTLFRSTH